MEFDLMLGLRPGGLFKLQRKNLTEQGIHVETAKTGKVLLFAWDDELREVVERAKKLRRVGSMYLLPNQQGRPYTVDGFRQLWRRVMLRYAAQGGTKFQFRDLRAKSASDHETGEHLGHTSDDVLNRVYKRKPKLVTPLRIKD